MLRLPLGVDDAAVAAVANAAGIRVPALSAFRVTPAPSGGLVIGYGRLHETAVGSAVKALAAIVGAR